MPNADQCSEEAPAVAKSAQIQCDEQHPVASVSKQPSTSAQHGLRIEVPSDTALGDAINFADSPSSASSDYSHIRQLPTPVLANGSFPSTSQSPRAIDIRKRGSRQTQDMARAVSAYDSESPSKLPENTMSIPDASPSLRRTSNPSTFSKPFGEIPSPPMESEINPYKNQILLAPHIGQMFRCGSIVGTGAFSVVVSARSTEDANKVVAIKIISPPSENREAGYEFRSFVIRELDIMARLHHPAIVKLLDFNLSLSASSAPGAESSNKSLDPAVKQYIFLEYCPGGNLFNWLYGNYERRSSNVMFWRLMARIVAELISAVAYMHQHNVIHRDIKLENVLLNRDLTACDIPDPRLLEDAISTLTDFGLSKKLTSENELLRTKCGSQDYVSPELLMGLEYNGKLLDAWAIGVLVYSIIENRLPFDLPSPEFMQASGISPSIRRRRTKHSPAHRIAMIDWDWYCANNMVQDKTLDEESKAIISDLRRLVEALLVRKERRLSVQDVFGKEDFAWVKKAIPRNFCDQV